MSLTDQKLFIWLNITNKVRLPWLKHRSYKVAQEEQT